MFTGLIEGTGIIRGTTRTGSDMMLSIQPDFDMSDDCKTGDSIAVNGVCLTVTGIDNRIIKMYVSKETVSATTTSELRQGDKVNLERALRLSDRLGGHIVSGHVDGVGDILTKGQIDGSWCVRIGIDKSLSKYTIEKGSITIDGISLTINRCEERFFEVNIIPETGRQTTILHKKEGDRVNVETDLMAKYIEKLIKNERTSGNDKASSKIDSEMLTKYGFR